jgi:putative cardiolipin synthase
MDSEAVRRLASPAAARTKVPGSERMAANPVFRGRDPPGASTRRVAARLALLLGGCFTLPPRGPLPASQALQNPGVSPLAALGARPALESDPLRSGFRLMPEGSTAFNARIALIRQARVSIDAQYYIVQSDAVGARFLLELLEAARRGVRVRLLVDGLHVAGKDELLALLAVQPNFEVRVFNPLPVQQGPLAWRLLLSAGERSRINRRMHNKLFVVDNSVAVMGGRNMADEYFMQSGKANLIDMDVLVTGPLIRELSSSFDRLCWGAATPAAAAPVRNPRPCVRQSLRSSIQGA